MSAGERKPNFLPLPLSDNHNDDTRTVKLHRSNNGTISLSVPGRNISHIERFFRRRCVRDLLGIGPHPLGIYPDVKEVSEAESVRHAMVRRLRMNEGSSKTVAIIVGDGRTPRVGALLAFTTAWEVYSIDPALMPGAWSDIRRFKAIPCNVENVPLMLVGGMRLSGVERVVVAAPHSHALLDDAVALARRSYPNARRMDAIAMPCCVRQTITGREHCDIRYEDLGVWSAKSVIQIWTNVV